MNLPQDIRDPFNARLALIKETALYYDLDPEDRDAYLLASGLRAGENLRKIPETENNDSMN